MNETINTEVMTEENTTAETVMMDETMNETATSITEQAATEQEPTNGGFFQKHKKVLIRAGIGVAAVAAGALLVRHFLKKGNDQEAPVEQPAASAQVPATTAVQDMEPVGPQGEAERVTIEQPVAEPQQAATEQKPQQTTTENKPNA